MKNLVPWLKAHWPIPALTLVALAAVPTAYYFASDMAAQHEKEFGDTVKKDADAVSATAAKISYYIPSVDGSGKMLEKSAPANEAMIKRYGEIWTEVQSKVGAVSESGLKFNQSDHKPLIDNYFPKPSDESQATLTVRGREFVAELIKFHRKILADARAGAPFSNDELAKRLSEHAATTEAKIRAETGRDLNAEEKQKLASELSDMRLGEYRRRARELGVYADHSVFEGVPNEVPDKAPSLAESYDKQERAWVHQDIFRAIARANGTSAGGIADSVVKRVIRLNVSGPKWDSGQGGPQPAAFDPGEDKVPLNFSNTVTGRISGPGSKNKWYDIRTVTLEVVISSQRIPEFVDALSATNFMAVLDADLKRVEPLSDLREGYDYGPDHVVRATFLIETVWLREWRKPWMPNDVQAALGMLEGVAGNDAASAPAAAPRPPRNRPGGAPAGGGGGGRGARGD